MANLEGKTALVVGASSGVGKATVKSLISEGARVVAVARGAEGLAELRSRLGDGLELVRADAADPSTAGRLLTEHRPDYVVLTAGVRPHTAPLDEQTWETFTEAWNSDTKAAFHFAKAALGIPLRDGSVVVVVSSGAAINGSFLSGGYAGAKRMQWWLAGYAQKVADSKQLGIRFLAVLPKQLIEGTAIAGLASAGYGKTLGIAPADYMKRFEVPLDCDKVAAAVVGALRGEVARDLTAIAVTGRGVESLA
jgi:NAD(P)-dependent dehydrogenase (short-subunit alcohol dehydrogenase family)